MIIFALAAFFIHSSHAKTLSSTVVYTLSWINCTACRIETHVAFLRILKIEKTITCSDSCFRKKKSIVFLSESVLCKICPHSNACSQEQPSATSTSFRLKLQTYDGIL